MKNFFNRTLDNFLEVFFSDPETRSIAKRVISILLVAGILVCLVPSLAGIIKIAGILIVAPFLIIQIEKRNKKK